MVDICEVLEHLIEEFEQITGAPARIASNTGKPNPSYSEGNANKLAALINKGKSLSSTKPVKITLFSNSNCFILV